MRGNQERFGIFVRKLSLCSENSFVLKRLFILWHNVMTQIVECEDVKYLSMCFSVNVTTQSIKKKLHNLHEYF